MGKYTRRKTTQTVEDMIVWSEVSSFLTGGKDRIRKNRIPTAHEKKIEELLTYLQAWKNDVKLFSEAQLKEALDKIDTKTILMVEMSIVDRDENHFSGK